MMPENRRENEEEEYVEYRVTIVFRTIEKMCEGVSRLLKGNYDETGCVWREIEIDHEDFRVILNRSCDAQFIARYWLLDENQQPIYCEISEEVTYRE